MRALLSGLVVAAPIAPLDAALAAPGARDGAALAAPAGGSAAGRASVARTVAAPRGSVVTSPRYVPVALLYARRGDRARGRGSPAGPLAFVAPGATRPRAQSGLLALAGEGARWLGGTLAFVGATAKSPDDGVLQTVDRRGAPVRRIVELGRDRALMGHADVSATGGVWVTRACASSQIRGAALPAAATIGATEPACRLRLRHRTPPYAAASLSVGRTGRRLLRARPRPRVRIEARYGAGRPGAVTRRVAQIVALEG